MNPRVTNLASKRVLFIWCPIQVKKKIFGPPLIVVHMQENCKKFNTVSNKWLIATDFETYGTYLSRFLVQRLIYQMLEVQEVCMQIKPFC